MGIHLPSVILHAKQVLKLLSRHPTDVPKGHIAVYVGKIRTTRFVVPILYLKHPSFLDLLKQAEEEFGFDHPMGGWSYDSVRRTCLYRSHFSVTWLLKYERIVARFSLKILEV